MADLSVPQQIANYAVRNVLTNAGYILWSQGGKSKVHEYILKDIKAEYLDIWKNTLDRFNFLCVYCGKGLDGKPEREHLIMMNQFQCGLEHPGNIVPCCASCNKRHQTVDWANHLKEKCHGDKNDYDVRYEKIMDHIKFYGFTFFSEEELVEKSKFLQGLYRNVVQTLDDSLQKFMLFD